MGVAGARSELWDGAFLFVELGHAQDLPRKIISLIELMRRCIAWLGKGTGVVCAMYFIH